MYVHDTDSKAPVSAITIEHGLVRKNKINPKVLSHS